MNKPIIDITKVFKVGQWVAARPDGLIANSDIGYVVGETEVADYPNADETHTEYVIEGVLGRFTCHSEWMRRMSNQDILNHIKGYQATFICRVQESLRLSNDE